MKVIGHKNQIFYFEKVIKEDNFLSAYIFSGQEGVGKLEILKFVLMKYVCASKRGCGECNMCRRFKKITIPDINFILPDKISENLSELYEKGEWSIDNLRTDYFSREMVIGINTIRKIEGELATRPIELKRKFYIFLDADLMNREAQNAFLKILEEPPKFVTYFLITPYPDSLHITIRSRCIEIPFFSLKFEEFKEYFKYTKNIYFLYRFSKGSIGIAKKIIESKLEEEYGNLLRELARNKESEYFVYRKLDREYLKDKIFLLGFFIKEITELKMGRDKILKDHPFRNEIEFLNKRIDPYTLDLLYDKYYKILEGYKRNIPSFTLLYLFDSLRFGVP